jgi:hypothetical protein
VFLELVGVGERVVTDVDVVLEREGELAVGKFLGRNWDRRLRRLRLAGELGGRQAEDRPDYLPRDWFSQLKVCLNGKMRV